MAGAIPSFSTYPDFVHKEAQHTIGEEHSNNPGDLFDYVEFTPGTYKTGVLCVDDAQTAEATVTAAAAAGTYYLKSTGAFSNDVVGNTLRGALGYITEGNGKGQSFFIKNVVDANTIEIRVLKGGQGGWRTALTTSSKFRLVIPGRVSPGPSTRKARGIITYDEFTVPTNEYRYGYVQKTGLQDALAGGAIAANAAIKADADGKIVTGGVLADKIGETVFQVEAEDDFAFVELNIVTNRRSMRRARKRHDPNITVE